MSFDYDVVVIGAGAAGLAAAGDLSRAGLKVTILEARSRLGGRMFTRHDLNAVVELGAEFIHGLTPEIFEPLQKNNVPIEEVRGEPWCQENGELCSCEFFDEVDEILQAMTDQEPDESFSVWLERKFPNRENDPRLAEAKDRALRYVVGFNAADADKVSVHWLVQSRLADEKIQGERAFYMAGGYATLIGIFEKQLRAAGVSISLNTIVKSVQWSPGNVQLLAHGDSGPVTISTPRVLITVPLGVLQSAPGETGAIRFDPPLPSQKQQALNKLIMGKVMRVILRFRERFWEKVKPAGNEKTLANLGFLFSEDQNFPTWWTQMPRPTPILTGWAPAHYAEKLTEENEFVLMEQSLEGLSSIFHIDKAELEKTIEAFYVHDWQADPFARGAYSYVAVGGENAPRQLGEPIDATLFFAGEATDITGHNGTVHGAISSGNRAAQEILSSRT